MNIALLIALALGIAGTSNKTKREPQVLTPFERPLVLSGRNSSAAINIIVDSDTSESILNLQWSASDLVDRENSLITVLVDQQPIRTSRLSVAASKVGRGWTISLGQLEPGPHQVTLKTHLEVAGDPCLIRFSKEAWFRIETKSSIELPAKVESETDAGLRNLPTLWQGDKRLVQMVPPKNLSADSVLAFLEASAQLQVWGFTPTLDTQPKKLALILLEEDDEARLAKQLLAAPEQAHAIAGIDSRTLTIIARSESGLSDAIRQLSSSTNRALCPKQGACLLSKMSSEKKTKTEIEAEKENQALVLDLKTIGYKHGFVGQGSGTHVLRFVWQRPSTWSLTQPAQLHLDIRSPQSPLVDQDNTTVSVRVNGQPISTWHVYDGNKKHNERAALKAKVPMDFASDEALSFEVTIRIGLKEDVACEAINDEALWIVLEGSSRLLVERNEKRYDGIAAFYRSTETQRPTLSTEKAMTSWNEVLWLGAILHPFVDQTRSQRWQWTDESDQHARIEIHSLDKSSGIVAAYVTKAWWIDSFEGLPLLSLANSVRLSTATKGLLTIQLGRLTSKPPESPRYAALVDADALWSDPAWVGLEGDASVSDIHKVRSEDPSPSESLARIKSKEERKLQTINLIWAGLAGLLLLATAFYWRKRPTLVATGDIEEMNDKDNA